MSSEEVGLARNVPVVKVTSLQWSPKRYKNKNTHTHTRLRRYNQISDVFLGDVYASQDLKMRFWQFYLSLPHSFSLFSSHVVIRHDVPGPSGCDDYVLVLIQSAHTHTCTHVLSQGGEEKGHVSQVN